MARRTLEDLIKKLDRVEEQLKLKAPSFILKASVEFVNHKKEQIIYSEGVGSYSRKVYHPSSLKKKALTSAGTSFIESKIQAKEKTNWAGLRGAEGLNISYVDLWYSGKMWRSTMASKSNQVNFTSWAIVGGKTKDAKYKLAANRDRYGNFLYPNNKQKEHLVTNVKNSVKRLIIKIIK